MFQIIKLSDGIYKIYFGSKIDNISMFDWIFYIDLLDKNNIKFIEIFFNNNTNLVYDIDNKHGWNILKIEYLKNNICIICKDIIQSYYYNDEELLSKILQKIK